jgi:hypothetical protein
MRRSAGILSANAAERAALQCEANCERYIMAVGGKHCCQNKLFTLST